MPTSATGILKARARRERAQSRLDETHAELVRETLKAIQDGCTVVRAAEAAGVSRQAVHDWLRAESVTRLGMP